MGIKQDFIESGIRLLGGIQEGEFTTAAGERANIKFELDVLREPKFPNRLIRALALGELATKIAQYEPDIILPIPEGGNHLGDGLAKRLYLPIAYLEWVDKTPGRKRLAPRTEHDRELITSAGKVSLVDDVFTTGSSLLAANALPEVGGKVVVAGEVINRDDGTYTNQMPFPVESAVEKHTPLWKD